MTSNKLLTEIKTFSNLDDYHELLARPYNRRFKEEVDNYMTACNFDGLNILELGSGISEHAHYFSRRNLMILTDITKTLLEKNDPISARVICDAQVLPFKSESIDFVIYVGMLHHLPNQRKSLLEAARLLRTKGRIFICEPHRRSINYFYYLFRVALTKFIGVRLMAKFIGCFSPNESHLDTRAVEEIFNEGFKKKKWTFLFFRLPPLRIFKNFRLDVALSNRFDTFPIFRSFGTVVCYELVKTTSPDRA
jgi:ubiquinone/menaquinone biosynthesis C-methylase UbiE